MIDFLISIWGWLETLVSAIRDPSNGTYNPPGFVTYDHVTRAWLWLYSFLKDWQTLIGAMIALVAARWTINQMRSQEAEEKQRHKEALRRKLLSERAKMPDALSAVTAYCRQCATFLVSRGASIPLPNAPEQAIFALQQAIEHIDAEQAEQTYHLTSYFQVQRARLEHYNMKTYEDKPLYRAVRAAELVRLTALTNRLFDYARNRKLSTANQGLVLQPYSLNRSIQELTDLHDEMIFPEFTQKVLDVDRAENLREGLISE